MPPRSPIIAPFKAMARPASESVTCAPPPALCPMRCASRLSESTSRFQNTERFSALARCISASTVSCSGTRKRMGAPVPSSFRMVSTQRVVLPEPLRPVRQCTPMFLSSFKCFYFPFFSASACRCSRSSICSPRQPVNTARTMLSSVASISVCGTPQSSVSSPVGSKPYRR